MKCLLSAVQAATSPCFFTIEGLGREYMWDLLEETKTEKECCITYSEEVDTVSSGSVVMQSVCICV